MLRNLGDGYNVVIVLFLLRKNGCLDLKKGRGVATPTNRGKIYPPIEYSYAKEHYGIDELEWEKIVDRMGRNPNDMEAAIFSMLWSESYCNKSSASLLESIDRNNKRH